MENNTLLPYLVLAIIIAAFFLFREVMTWYWKQNKIVELLERIDSKLEVIANTDKETYDETKEQLRRLS
ncbi:hypothetical protein [Paenibacillus xanthanilyticus]|uniref:Uncharacterized protein n=1 Tax=Paenibacillus xanthanilyticus TaxID=1783531 RepID=A0ABV8KCJ8_9BACL